jgi:colanic acid biosynthesis glycosyl transferase WcaI
MRILLLGINYWPEVTGIAPFNTRRCEYLAGRGHGVTICTGFPYYPQWRKPREWRGRLWAHERRNGVNILRSWLYVPHRVTSALRILHEGSFVASALARAVGTRRPDLFMVISPPLALGLAAAFLSRIWSAPYIFHVEDLQPDAAADLAMLGNGSFMKLLYWIERFAYRRAALVSTLNEAMRTRIVDKGIPERKVVVFSHWSDPSLFRIPIAGGGAEFRRAFGLEGRFLVVHSGNMGVKQGLDVILGAAARSTGDPEITYLLVGDGAARQGLQDRASAQGLSNIRFLPVQPQQMFFDLLAAADLTLVTEQCTATNIAFPSKMETLMSAGRPILASLNAGGEAARVVTHSGAGEVVAAGDSSQLHGAILRLKSDPDRRRLMGERGRAYAGRHWDADRILPETEAALVAVANGQYPEHAAAEGTQTIGISEPGSPNSLGVRADTENTRKELGPETQIAASSTPFQS